MTREAGISTESIKVVFGIVGELQDGEKLEPVSDPECDEEQDYAEEKEQQSESENEQQDCITYLSWAAQSGKGVVGQGWEPCYSSGLRAEFPA